MMNAVKKVLFLFLFSVAAASLLSALELKIIAPPGTEIILPGGGSVFVDASGTCVFEDLASGDEVKFTTRMKGRYPADYVIKMGPNSRTFRLDPVPTGTFAFEAKFVDSGFAPSFGFEFYFNPEDAYFSLDLYQNFFRLSDISGNTGDVPSRYFLPMLGAGGYLVPSDIPVRVNLGLGMGCLFGGELPNPAYAVELSAGLEIGFAGHYIIFAEYNPRFFSPVGDGWAGFETLFGGGREVTPVGNWGFAGMPSTNFGLKIKF